MKQFLFLLPVFLICIAQVVLAQAWCSPGATWCFGFQYAQSNGYEVYTYTGDTLIGGEIQQVIAVESHYYTQDPPGYHDDTSSTPIYTRFTDSVLYGFNTSLGIWDTLIWYSAVPGEEWQVFQPVDFVCDCRYTVTDTGHTILDDIPLRYVQTTITGLECESGTRRFIERIGSVEGVFGLWECATGMDGHSLRNYQDLQLSYSPFGSPACDFINGITEQVPGQQTILFPNPGSDLVTIQGPRSFSSAEFLDRTGRICLTVELHSGNATGDVSALSPGVYIVRLRGQFGTSNKVFVKQ